jgi:RHS repeat-associated protein
MEKLTTAVRTHWKHRLPTPSGEVQVIRRSDGTTETLYLASDHLGSVDAVTNAAGTVLARPSFNAWGARRASNWQGAPSQSEWQAIADTTRRGYTGHEQLDNVMLVHMNGRVYDPAIGRFLSADPFIDCAGSTQGWNRYSYVKNSPLAFTDPGGYSSVATRGMSVAFQVRRIEFGPKGDGGAPSDGGAGGAPPGMEHLVFTDRRLTGELNSVFAQLDVDAMLREMAPRYGSPGGAEGAMARDTAKQREEEQKKCVEDCRVGKEGAIQTLAGAAGGATAGFMLSARSGNPRGIAVATVAGGAVGAVTGATNGFFSQGVQSYGGNHGQASAVSAMAGMSVGYTASAMAGGGSATFGSAAIGALSGGVGGALPGAAGAAGSSAVGAFGHIGASIKTRAGVAAVAAAVAGVAYGALSQAANDYCEAKCGPN